jgi:hypothetical protein
MVKVFYDSAPGLADQVMIAGEVYRRGKEYTVKDAVGELLKKKGFKSVKVVSEYKPKQAAKAIEAVAEMDGE